MAAVVERATAQIAGSISVALRTSDTGQAATRAIVERYVVTAIDFRDLIAITSTQLYSLTEPLRLARYRATGGCSWKNWLTCWPWPGPNSHPLSVASALAPHSRPSTRSSSIRRCGATTGWPRPRPPSGTRSFSTERATNPFRNLLIRM